MKNILLRKKDGVTGRWGDEEMLASQENKNRTQTACFARMKN